MRKYLIMGLIFVSFCIPIEIVMQEREQVALVLTDRMPHHDQVANTTINILKEMGYKTYKITNPGDITYFSSERILIAYIGHGDTTPLMHFGAEGAYMVDSLLARLEYTQLIMISSACYSGAWLKFSAPNRYIIATANFTMCYGLDRDWSPFEIDGSIPALLLLCYSQGHSLERVFPQWKQILQDFYWDLKIIGWDPFAHTYTPVQYDGIQGEVYL